MKRETKKNNITRMYEFSGGTDYRHLCFECSNCVTVNDESSKTKKKCLIFGNDGSAKSDWRSSHIACRLFGVDHYGNTVLQETKKASERVDGQMSIFDFL